MTGGPSRPCRAEDCQAPIEFMPSDKGRKWCLNVDARPQTRIVMVRRDDPDRLADPNDPTAVGRLVVVRTSHHVHYAETPACPAADRFKGGSQQPLFPRSR